MSPTPCLPAEPSALLSKKRGGLGDFGGSPLLPCGLSVTPLGEVAAVPMPGAAQHRDRIPKQLICLPSGSAGALCSRRLCLPRPWDLLLGSGETVDQLLTLSCKRQGSPTPPSSPRPSSGTLSRTLCFSGPFSTTAQMGHSRTFPLLSRLLSPSRTDTGLSLKSFGPGSVEGMRM